MAVADYRNEEGIEAKRGRPTKGEKPGKRQLSVLYEKQGLSIREIALSLGCTKDMIFRSMREYKIPPRGKAKPSRLSEYGLEFLEEGIKEKGLRGFARVLRVDKSTLLYYVNKRKQKK